MGARRVQAEGDGSDGGAIVKRSPLALALFLSAACGGAPFTSDRALSSPRERSRLTEMQMPPPTPPRLSGGKAPSGRAGARIILSTVDSGGSEKPDAGAGEASRDAAPDAPAEGAPPDALEDRLEDSMASASDAPEDTRTSGLVCHGVSCPLCPITLPCCTSGGACGCALSSGAGGCQ